MTTYDIAAAADEVWAEICGDIAAGNLPPLIDEFADLHDYVDANEYGGFTDPARRAGWPSEELAKVQEAVEAKMKADRAARIAAGRPTLVKLVGEARDGWMHNFYSTSHYIAEAIVSGAITDADIDAYPIPETGDFYPEEVSRDLAHKAGMGWPGDETNAPIDSDAEAVGVSVECLRDVLTGKASVHGDGWSFYEEDLKEAKVRLEDVEDLLKAHTTLQQAAQLIIDADESLR